MERAAKEADELSQRLEKNYEKAEAALDAKVSKEAEKKKKLETDPAKAKKRSSAADSEPGKAKKKKVDLEISDDEKVKATKKDKEKTEAGDKAKAKEEKEKVKVEKGEISESGDELVTRDKDKKTLKKEKAKEDEKAKAKAKTEEKEAAAELEDRLKALEEAAEVPGKGKKKEKTKDKKQKVKNGVEVSASEDEPEEIKAKKKKLKKAEEVSASGEEADDLKGKVKKRKEKAEKTAKGEEVSNSEAETPKGKKNTAIDISESEEEIASRKRKNKKRVKKTIGGREVEITEDEDEPLEKSRSSKRQEVDDLSTEGRVKARRREARNRVRGDDGDDYADDLRNEPPDKGRYITGDPSTPRGQRPPPRRQQAYTDFGNDSGGSAQAARAPPPVPMPNETAQAFQGRMKDYHLGQPSRPLDLDNGMRDGGAIPGSKVRTNDLKNARSNGLEDEQDIDNAVQGDTGARNDTAQAHRGGESLVKPGDTRGQKKMTSKEKKEAERRRLRDQYMEDGFAEDEDGEVEDDDKTDSKAKESLPLKRDASARVGEKEEGNDDMSEDGEGESRKGRDIRRRKKDEKEKVSGDIYSAEPDWVKEKRIAEEDMLKEQAAAQEAQTPQEESGLLMPKLNAAQLAESAEESPDEDPNQWSRARKSKRRAKDTEPVTMHGKPVEEQPSVAQLDNSAGISLEQKARREEQTERDFMIRQRQNDIQDDLDSQSFDPTKRQHRARMDEDFENGETVSPPLVAPQENMQEETIDEAKRQMVSEGLPPEPEPRSTTTRAREEAELKKTGVYDTPLPDDDDELNLESSISPKPRVKSGSDKRLVNDELPPVPKPKTADARAREEAELINAGVYSTPLPEDDEDDLNEPASPRAASERNTQKKNVHSPDGLPPVPKPKSRADVAREEDALFEAGVYTTPLPESNDSDLEEQDSERLPHAKREAEKARVAEGLPPVPQRQDTMDRIEHERELNKAGVYRTPLPAADDDDLEEPTAHTVNDVRENTGKKPRPTEEPTLPPVLGRKTSAARAREQDEMTRAEVDARALSDGHDDGRAIPSESTKHSVTNQTAHDVHEPQNKEAKPLDPNTQAKVRQLASQLEKDLTGQPKESEKLTSELENRTGVVDLETGLPKDRPAGPLSTEETLHVVASAWENEQDAKLKQRKDDAIKKDKYDALRKEMGRATQGLEGSLKEDKTVENARVREESGGGGTKSKKTAGSVAPDAWDDDSDLETVIADEGEWVDDLLC